MKVRKFKQNQTKPANPPPPTSQKRGLREYRKQLQILKKKKPTPPKPNPQNQNKETQEKPSVGERQCTPSV